MTHHSLLNIIILVIFNEPGHRKTYKMLCPQHRLNYSACTSMQADVCFCWVHALFCWFSHALALCRPLIVTYVQDLAQGLAGLPEITSYRKNPTNSDTRKNAVIILKLEQYRFTTE